MSGNPFLLVTPATRGLSLALVRHFLRSTDLPVFATYRSGHESSVKKSMLERIDNVDPERLKLIPLDLTSEDSIARAPERLAELLPKDRESYLHTGFFTGGVLAPEKQPADLDLATIRHTFDINVISHLLLIKHFSRFLPTRKQSNLLSAPAKWVHVTARVGSISDNKMGGWYSYRSSKAALFQVVKTFDHQLQMKGSPSICVGVHPGTVKTDLSKGFWDSVAKEKLFSPEYSAGCLADVVGGLQEDQRGRVWDWAGKEIQP